MNSQESTQKLANVLSISHASKEEEGLPPFDIRKLRNKKVFPQMHYTVWCFFSYTLLFALVHIENYTCVHNRLSYSVPIRYMMLLIGVSANFIQSLDVFSIERGDRKHRQAVWSSSPFFFVCICFSFILGSFFGLLLHTIHIHRLIEMHIEHPASNIYNLIESIWDGLTRSSKYRMFVCLELLNTSLYCFLVSPKFRKLLIYLVHTFTVVLQLFYAQMLVSYICQGSFKSADPSLEEKAQKEIVLYIAEVFREVACIRTLIYLHSIWANGSIWIANMHMRLFQRFSLAGKECTAIFTGWMTYHLFLFFLLFAGIWAFFKYIPITLL
ncbi:hypothetical protein NEFER03_2209 [Nematocida sp. LUAm3]|nr:hypothetical protein NEFER03_0631 [Nematocida sp. LUAm3]KAI5171854.1 hypothetical protein NEFER03_1119 [Nematocida sp. LUAm3]KAI5173262.1 hypothetical protein NEFER03_2209 [Nematocida sp. LUAm3]KAI5176429.1 hypothetical protein NEFER02_2192 [Nematocida sp. LUAm2]KAI5179288.1 hypothetical protein NEFER01_2137 [Nematocida sp. LUAm1]